MKGWFEELKDKKTKQESQQDANTGGPTEQTNEWIMYRFMRKE